jgi:hypothetical protein
MNTKTLIYTTLAERLQVEAALALESVNILEETIVLSEMLCDQFNQTFCGEVAEA